MKKLFYGIIILALGIALYLVYSEKSLPVQMAVVKEGPFVETLTYEGVVRSQKRQTLYAPASGNLETFQLKIGDLVTRGQLITRLNWDRVESLRAPVSGVITQVHRSSAGPILRGEPILEISDLKDLEVVVDMLTTDAVKVEEGSLASIIRWGGETELPAKVRSVSRAAEVKVSALGVDEQRTEVRLSFEEDSPGVMERLGDNYHVEVIFTLSRVENALIVPLGALFKDEDHWAVYKLVDGRAKLARVKLGNKNDRQSMVLEGLSPGDQVVLFPGDKIKEGVLLSAPSK